MRTNRQAVDDAIREEVTNVYGEYDGAAVCVSLALQFAALAMEQADDDMRKAAIRNALSNLRDAGFSLPRDPYAHCCNDAAEAEAHEQALEA